MGVRRLGNQRGKVEFERFVIDRPLIGEGIVYASSRSWAARVKQVFSSLGKMLVVTPASRSHIADCRPFGNLKRFHPFSRILSKMQFVPSPRTAPRAAKITSLARPWAEFPGQADFDDLGTDQVEGAAGHRDGSIPVRRRRSRSFRSAAGRGMAVAAQRRLAGDTEALKVDLVNNSVSRTGRRSPFCRRHGLPSSGGRRRFQSLPE